MKQCEQGNGVSVYDHGIQVAARYADLWRLIHGQQPNLEWPRLSPDDIALMLTLSQRAHAPSAIARYQIYHDCGKPYCKAIDENGRVHFPDHACVSANLWQLMFPDDQLGHDMLKYDMCPHTARGDELDQFLMMDIAPTLVLTGIASIYANAEVLFGGFETDSFKMKLKHTKKLIKRLVA